MGLRELETAILDELRKVANDNSLRIKDIMEWSTSIISPEGGEAIFYLPLLSINVAVKVQPKRKLRK